MFAREISGGIAALVPYWFHIAVHIISIAWYFAIKRRVDRVPPATTARMCVPAIWITFFHAVVMAMNGSLSWTQVILGLAINAGLMVLFFRKWIDAHEVAR